MSARDAPASLHAGLVIQDRFRLVRPLGQGGMGTVWVAWHTTLNIEIAIKFIDAALGARDDVLSRFAQEARTAARIQSPHVVRILDYGADQWRRPYIAMELLRGEPLSSKLDREGPLAPSEVSQLLAQSCRGLSKAHAEGIVHRDLKPENLFLCPEDDGYVLKIVDFGIARADSPMSGSSHKTGTGQLLGTPLYMSPEQALGQSGIDFRSDLYSLAVVAYRCLTGRLPFDADALGALIVAISTTPPPPPSSVRRGLSPAIDAWFARALHKTPGMRCASAKELADTFAAACATGAAAGAEDRTLPAEPMATATGGTFSGAAATHHDDPIDIPTHRPVWLYAVVGALAAGMVGAALWTTGRSTAGPTASPSSPVPAATLAASSSIAPAASIASVVADAPSPSAAAPSAPGEPETAPAAPAATTAPQVPQVPQATAGPGRPRGAATAIRDPRARSGATTKPAAPRPSTTTDYGL